MFVVRFCELWLSFLATKSEEYSPDKNSVDSTIVVLATMSSPIDASSSPTRSVEIPTSIATSNSLTKPL